MNIPLGQRIAKRLEAVGGPQPPLQNLAADIVLICSNEASGWTNRSDDAMRIPDVLSEAANHLRTLAKGTT